MSKEQETAKSLDRLGAYLRLDMAKDVLDTANERVDSIVAENYIHDAINAIDNAISVLILVMNRAADRAAERAAMERA